MSSGPGCQLSASSWLTLPRLWLVLPLRGFWVDREPTAVRRQLDGEGGPHTPPSLEVPMERVTLSHSQGLGFLFRGRGDPAVECRTRHPRNDQVRVRQQGGLPWGVGDGPHLAPSPSLCARAPPVPPSPELSTTARGTAAPALPPAAVRSSPQPTRRMCVSFTKVRGAPPARAGAPRSPQSPQRHPRVWALAWPGLQGPCLVGRVGWGGVRLPGEEAVVWARWFPGEGAPVGDGKTGCSGRTQPCGGVWLGACAHVCQEGG